MHELSAVERRERLIEIVEDRQRISIEEICATFAISPATARRDLEMLAENGKVRRFHGGALALRNVPPEPPVAQRTADQGDEKRRIGAAAAALVKEGDSVFLGSGTTTLEVAKNLRQYRNLTVITNSLLVMNALADASSITLISLGGMLRANELSFIGHLTEQALGELRVAKVIMGTRAADIEHGLSNEYLPETQTDRAILRIGEQVIVVADHTKCGRVSNVRFAPITQVSTFITDAQTDPTFVEGLRARGVRTIVV